MIATITNTGAAGGESTQGGTGTAGAITYDSGSFGFTVDGASGFTMAVTGGAGGAGVDGGGAGGQGGDADTAQITVTAPPVTAMVKPDAPSTVNPNEPLS